MHRVVLLLVVAALTLATPDCSLHCKQWTNAAGTVCFNFVPCTFAVHDLRVEYADGSAFSQRSNATSIAECGASGSGTQLSITVPLTEGGNAALAWMYADALTPSLCQITLPSAGTDTTLHLLGVSVSAPAAPLLVWPDTKMAAAVCPDGDVAPDTGMVATALPQPVCYSDVGALAQLAGTNGSVTAQWRFETLLDGAIASTQLTLGSLVIDTSQSDISCVYNLGVVLLQVYDVAANAWALSWTYTTYDSCTELLTALAAGTDTAPQVESIVVVVSDDQIYQWKRDVSAQQATTRLSDRQVACTLSEPVPSQTPVSGTRPVIPFVDCVEVSALGKCTASFGYYNPNSWPVVLEPSTTANQLVRLVGYEHSPLPSVFEPGVHNNTLRVSYACNSRGLPTVAWKLRTAVPATLAAMMQNDECATSCQTDVLQTLTRCSGFYTRTPTPTRTPAARTQLVDVLRCARSDTTSPQCVFAH